MMEHIDDIEKGNPPEEMRQIQRKAHDTMLEQVLREKSVLRAMQHQIDALLVSEKLDRRFSLPTLLNAICQHLKRPLQFTLVKTCIPSEAKQSSRLSLSACTLVSPLFMLNCVRS